MNFLVRFFFFLSFLAYSLGIGGASQRAVSGSLAILLLGAGFALGFLSFFCSLLTLVFSRGGNGRREMSITSFLALILGVGQLGALVYLYVIVYMPYPRINDVTTNTSQPPDFVGKDNGVAAVEGQEFLTTENSGRVYNPAFAPIQEAAYPDIKTRHFDYDAKIVYKAAVVTINQFPSWQMGITDAEKMHVEALEESETFHLVDDIVIQVHALGPEKSSVEMRSRSRGNPFDMGKNANRIREFMRKLDPAVRRIAEREKAKAAAEGKLPPSGLGEGASTATQPPLNAAPVTVVAPVLPAATAVTNPTPGSTPTPDAPAAAAAPPAPNPAPSKSPPAPPMPPISNPAINRALGAGAADVGD